VKALSIFVLGFAISCASAAAQDLTAGKTPAQLFRSDCAECHRSPGSVAGARDVHALAAFLREHYTSKSQTADALAAYVSSFAGTGAAVRNRGTGVAAPASGEPPPARRRNRGQGDATAAAAGGNASPLEDTPSRRRASSVSGDVETKRAHNDRDVPRPPGVIAATPASAKSNARTRKGEPREARAPVSRLRSGSANVEAGKTAGPKARKRRDAVGDVVAPAAEVPAQTKANDMLTAPDPVPGQGNVSPPAASPLP
jgi:hypothetical protein